MASHRPYRPGLGIEAALTEIEMNRGTQYDAAVVDACLRLFHMKGYQLAPSMSSVLRNYSRRACYAGVPTNHHLLEGAVMSEYS